VTFRVLWKTAIVAAIFTTSGSPSSAIAAPIVDQDFLQTNYNAAAPAVTAHQWIGINFTVGISGKLTQVDLPLWQNTGAQLDSFSVNLTTLVGGFPGSVLDSTPFSTAVLPTFTSGGLTVGSPVIPVQAIFSDGGIDVVVGQQLAVVVSRTTGLDTIPYWILWDTNTALTDPNYSFSTDQGSTWSNDPNSAGFRTVGFRTYVDPSELSVPEPLTVSLFGAGLGGIVIMRHRKKVKDK